MMVEIMEARYEDIKKRSDVDEKWLDRKVREKIDDEMLAKELEELEDDFRDHEYQYEEAG